MTHNEMLQSFLKGVFGEENIINTRSLVKPLTITVSNGEIIRMINLTPRVTEEGPMMDVVLTGTDEQYIEMSEDTKLLDSALSAIQDWMTDTLGTIQQD